MEDQLYMTAEEAAAALGVSVATVYAYVSRKILRSHKAPGARASKYWRADVDRLRAKFPAGARREVDPLVSQTQITVITQEGPFYRGHSAITLAETETIESVAALLWKADQSAVFPAEAPASSPAIEAFWPPFAGMSSIDKAMAIFPVIERENPRAYDLSAAGFARTAAEAMRWFATIMIGAERPSGAPLHEVVTRRVAQDEALKDIVRRLLVLSADHELDPTTYAVRAVANVGMNPYRLIVAGLIASTGRRLPYGRVESLSRLLDEISAAPDPKSVMVGRLRDGEELPGFGSNQYPLGDPRAAALLSALNHNLHDDPELKKLNAAIEVAVEVTGLKPDFGLANLFVGRKLGLTKQEGLTLRLGRMAGWMAHAMEQYLDHDFVRPGAAYVGVLPGNGDAKPLAGAIEPGASQRRKSATPKN